jgi:hypothetical protein
LSQSHEASLAVSKVCHEIANYLSVIKFIQDDIKNSNLSEMDELLTNIDMIEQTLKFFRSVYTSFNDDLTLSISSLYSLKNIKIIDECNVLEETVCTRISNIICGILYIFMKSCKKNDSVLITKDNIFVCRVSFDRVGLSLPQSIINAFKDVNAEPNAFNIFCKYLQKLARDESLHLSISENEVGQQQITLESASSF